MMRSKRPDRFPRNPDTLTPLSARGLRWTHVTIKLVRSEFTSVVTRACPERIRRVESLRGRMSETERQVEGWFESLLSESFGG